MGIFDGIRAAGNDASRQKGLYYAIEADKSATEAAAKQRALTKAKLGGITKGLHELTMLAQEDHNKGIPKEQQWDYGTTQKQIMADPTSGYGKLINGFMQNHPGVFKKLSSNPNRDMSEFAANHIAGVKLITDFSGFGNADELAAQYPSGAYQVNLRKRANTMTEDVMGGLASLLPESMEEIVPWTRNASSDPNDAMELIPAEDVNEEIQRQQRLYGNTSPYIANLHAKQVRNIGGELNLYAPDPRLTASRATEMNTDNITSKEFDDASFRKPREKFAEASYAYKKALMQENAANKRNEYATDKKTITAALKGVTGKGTAPTDRMIAQMEKVITKAEDGRLKGQYLFTQANILANQLFNVANNPNATDQQQQMFDLHYPAIQQQQIKGFMQHVRGTDKFKTSWWELWDKEWWDGRLEEPDESALAESMRLTIEDGVEYVRILKPSKTGANKTLEYGDPVRLSEFPKAFQPWLQKLLGGKAEPPVDESTNANISNYTPEQKQAIAKAAENIRKKRGVLNQ